MVFQSSAFQPEPKPRFGRLKSIWRAVCAFAMPANGLSPLEESAWQRGKRQASDLANGRGILFMIVCAPLFAVGGLFVLTSVSLPLRVVFAALLGLSIALAAAFLISGAYALRAPYSQRSEARDLLRNEREEHLRQLDVERQKAAADHKRERAAFDEQWGKTEDLRGQLGRAENELHDLRLRLEAAKDEPTVLARAEERRRRKVVEDLFGRVHRRGVEFLEEPTFISDLTVLEWHRDMYRLVREAYGDGEAAIFLESLPPEAEFEPDSPTEWIKAHLKPVASMIERVTSLDPRDEFDVTEWEAFFF